MYELPLQYFIKLIVELVKIPVYISRGLLEFAQELKMTVPDGARAWVALLVSLFVILLPIFIDKCRSKSSRVIFLYGLLCCLFTGLIIYFPYASIYFDLYSYNIKITTTVKKIVNKPISENFPVNSWSSSDCGVSESRSQIFCSSIVDEVARVEPVIASANCGSGISSISVDNLKKGCVNVVASIKGCGIEKLPFGIKNCRGRGWLSYSLSVFGSKLEEETERSDQFDRILSADSPVVVPLGIDLIDSSKRIEYRVVISNVNKSDIVLTDKNSSDGDFSSSIFADGTLRIVFGRR